MELSSEYHLNAGQDAVWWVLTNPTLLKDEVRGLTKFEEESPGRFIGEVKVGIGFFKVTFSGNLNISEQDPPNGYKVRVMGSGRGGSLDGIGTVSLSSNSATATTVKVVGRAKVGGMIGAAGDRAVQGAANKILEQFFKKVEAHARKKADTG